MNEERIIENQANAVLAAIGAEIMNLSIFRMARGDREEGIETKRIQELIETMADVSVQNMILQNALGVTNEQFTKAFSERLDAVTTRPGVESDD